MAEVNQQEIQDVQEKAVRISERLKSDHAFREKYKDDPEGTLKAEGLPETAAHALLSIAAKDVGSDDVQGHCFQENPLEGWIDGSGIWHPGYDIFDPNSWPKQW